MSDGRLLLAVLDTFHDFLREREDKNKPNHVTNNTDLVKYVLTTIQPELDSEKEYIAQHPVIMNLVNKINKDTRLNSKFESAVLDYCKQQIPNMISVNIPITLPTETFTDQCLQIFKVSRVIFVEDTLGSVKHNYFCDLRSTLQYKGLFDKLDAWPRKKVENFDTKCVQSEFQNYALKKEDKVLIEYDSITADNVNQQIHFTQKDRLQISKKQIHAIGVSEFRRRIYNIESNKSIDVALSLIEESYGLPSAWANSENRFRYIRSLYDLKRSGDYMTVEAALQANKNRSPDVIYIFVSVDRMAVGYALTRGVPSILVPVRKSGNAAMTIYNPPNQPSATPSVTASARASATASARASATASARASATASATATAPNQAATQVPTSSSRSVVTTEKRNAIYNELKIPGTHVQTALRHHGLQSTPEILQYLLSKNPYPEIKTKLTSNYRGSLARIHGGKTLQHRPELTIELPSLQYKTPISYQAIALEALDKTFPTTTLMQSLDLSDPLYEILQIVNKKGMSELSTFEYLIFRFLTFPPKDMPGIMRPHDGDRSTPRRSHSFASTGGKT